MTKNKSDPRRFEWLQPPLIDHCDWLDSSGSPIVSSRPQSFPASSSVSRRLRASNVDEIVLLHGTFVGSDVLGILRGVSRFLPGIAGQINSLTKSIFDSQLGSLANYDLVYERLLKIFVNEKTVEDRSIKVRRISWSGENNHLGRLDAVISLLDDALKIQSRQDRQSKRRILVLAHSHGGNVMAMATQLLASSMADRQKWLSGLQWQYRTPFFGRIERPAWHRVCQALLSDDAIWPTIDVATFGTPNRYRFGCNIGGLVHLVNHHPIDPDDPTRAVLPKSIDDLLDARSGDYIQQLGVANTDITPPAIAFRDWLANRRIQKQFEPDARGRFNVSALWKRLIGGNRIAADGTTLLCDYPTDRFGAYRNVFGHAVYTHPMYLPYHMDQITRRLYAG